MSISTTSPLQAGANHLEKTKAVAGAFDDAAMAAANATRAASTPMSATAPKPATMPQSGTDGFKAAIQRGILRP